MLNICFTADHELFSGHNYVKEEDILIIPTYQLMEVLEDYSIPLCLMTDVWSIIRYRELEIDSPYVSMMDNQLRNAIARGHDVQLHIHPHWLTSEYHDGRWLFDFSKFTLHSFPFEGDFVHEGRRIINEGKRYLVNLLKPIDASYECIAFRAGGWCLQPEEKLLEALVAEGILIDTTVFCGGYGVQEDAYFNFRNVPNKPNWWIDPKKGLEYEANRAEGYLMEVTIGSYSAIPMIGLKKLIYKPCRIRLQDKEDSLRGCSMDVVIKKSRFKNLLNKIRDFFFKPIMFSFDSACMEVMIDVMKYYLKSFDCTNQEVYISLIGHPKTLTKTSLGEIQKFCEKVTSKYSNLVRFVRLRDLLSYLIIVTHSVILDLEVLLCELV